METNNMAKLIDKSRTGIPGHSKLSKVVNQHSWGENAAVKRGYCKGTEVTHGFARGIGPQEPQAPEDQHGPKYDNDVKDGWLRGGGPNQAEGRPGYAPSYRAPHGTGSRPKIRPSDVGGGNTTEPQRGRR
jgi:hypothetical protein